VSEVDTGSRKENASKQESNARPEAGFSWPASIMQDGRHRFAVVGERQLIKIAQPWAGA